MHRPLIEADFELLADACFNAPFVLLAHDKGQVSQGVKACIFLLCLRVIPLQLSALLPCSVSVHTEFLPPAWLLTLAARAGAFLTFSMGTRQRVVWVLLRGT